MEGFGDTQYCEDALRELRLREAKDSPNMSLSFWRMWDIIRSREVLGSLQRSEVETAEGDPELDKPPKVEKGLFSAADHTTTVGSDSITGYRNWSSFTAHRKEGMAANPLLLAYCRNEDCFEKVGT